MPRVAASGLRRVAFASAVLVVLGLLPLLVLQLRQDLALRADSAATAPGPGAGNAQRLLWLATRDTDGTDAAAVRETARALLRSGPLHAIAYASLARVERGSGQAERALELLRTALRHDRRDVHARAHLLDHAAAGGDWPEAVRHADLLLRLGLGGRDELFGALIGSVHHAAARDELLRRLGEPPPWRAAFLAHLARPEVPLVLAEAVFDPLRTARLPLAGTERERWIERLLREGQAARAYALWLEALDAAERGVSANLHDGGFELPPSDSGFGWRFGRVPGASIERRATNGVLGGKALLLEFHGQQVAFGHVRQRLVLWPGHYRLSGTVKPEGLQNERGLQWQVRCDSGTALGESTRFTGNTDWRPFELAFAVPPTGCASQWLQLVLPARVAAERWVAGRIWFDGMQIQRAESGPEPSR